VKSVYFIFVQATLTELRRDTARVVCPVIPGGERLTLTDHGQPCAEIVPLRKIDRKALCQALIDLGPIDLLSRK
jgi:antitoxin (DNA-binding transcriptional repressor) of toxin-antitoxin stability system